ncbi:hypothetical protein SAMN05421688_1705 [Poseidonocella pacifica]|uniref:Uncharacterized protein n=1 Tax=Poseidonocella pacifica TaxID=871651 RepID=A0A1I0WRH3_9RHOB|nr:hypothetical protein [Poseidonocella pacifica]SFA91355.1 hypothetical protein SAMN05421688_1705 [Poseidonocella pacifica]
MATRKQAVLIVHGMGEQIPMQTLRSFIDTVWTTDDALVRRDRPDSETGESPRAKNTVWAKPDAAYDNFELRRVTTERTENGWRADFYEFYWAHLMHGTTWQHVTSWLRTLLWRNPRTRVPRPVLATWISLWVIVLLGVFALLWTSLPMVKEALPLPAWLGWVLLGVIALSPILLRTVMIDRFGDVARYVMAKPANVARRQEIRANGVALLERLIESDEYDRVIVAAHSLGTIVALDILNQTFARTNKRFNKDRIGPQPERAKLEAMVRVALGLEDGEAPEDFTAAYQEQQKKALAELSSQGNPWKVTDFISMGSPLTHAEFLIAADRDDLRELQRRRVVPCCPPALEYDSRTGSRHWTYRSGVVRSEGEEFDPVAPRCPHHGAVFGYTRWTNLYSPQSRIVKGDLISGPVAEPFALERGEKSARGARDIAVLPEGLVTHNHYWNGERRMSTDAPDKTPEHVRILREILDLDAP